MGEVRHNCGFCVTHSLHDAYNFTKSLQHRGREAVGIAAIADNRIDVLKWAGTVDRFDLETLHYIFHGTYHSFMGHVRYATRGKKDRILEDAHPIAIGGKAEKRKNHVIIRECELAIVHNGQIDDKYFEGVELSNLKTGTDTEKVLRFYRERGEIEIIKKIPGAYSMAIADLRKKEIMVLRDSRGLRPGVLGWGWKDGKYAVASEPVALQQNEAEISEDLDLGSIYYLSSDGTYRKLRVVEPRPKHCFFEYNYISHFSSTLNELEVRRVRIKLGEKLADEFPLKADFVTYMPRCPMPAARSYAEKRGIPFFPVFYKPRAERAFLGSTTEERKESINENLWLLPGIKEKIKGKKGICIDDSTIRGNNLRRARELMYADGEVQSVVLLNYTPKIGIIGSDGAERGCLFGVDMPPNDNFIARNRSDEQISEEMGIDVRFLSLEGMLETYKELGMPPDNLCTFCVGGKHPFEA